MSKTPAEPKGELSEEDLSGLVAEEIRAAVLFDASDLADRRKRSLEYLRGEMSDTPSRPNGSTVTSRDLADTVSWMLPGIMRVFMSSDRMFEYEATAPKGSSDPASLKRAEDFADQASDYISYVFMKDNDGYRTVYDATHDSMLNSYGVVKHWWDDTPETETSFHTRLTEMQVAQLTEDEEVKVLATTKNKEQDQALDPTTGQVVMVDTYDVKIERTTSRGRLAVEAIAPEMFLIDQTAVTIDGARFIAQRDPYMTRSRLIEMGFDKETVDQLPGERFAVFSEVESARRPQVTTPTPRLTRSTEYIDYYECYLKADVDGDGVAETCRVHFAGASSAGKILDWEVWEDDIPFSDIPCYPKPHDFQGESVADRTVDIQQVKTVLTRQANDNLYASNLPMREIEEGTVLNPDILISPKFGGIVWRKKGSLASAPTVPHVVPFVADKVFAALEYYDRTLEKRTGVTAMSMALDPETLQNQSATANQNAHDASYSQNELVARNMAELGWRRVGRQMLRLIVKHQDRPRTIRLRGKFVEMDPRQWDAEMDVTVNTGLGTGSRDRDAMMLQGVLADQLAITDRFAGTGFHDLAIDMIPRIRQTLIKKAESAGLRNPDQYYPEIDDQTIAGMKQQAAQKAQQPPMEIQIKQMELQAQGQMKQQEIAANTQATQQIETLKAQGNQVKEAAQLEGDLQKAEADRSNTLVIEGQKLAFEREKLATETQLKQQEMQLKYQLETQKMEAQQATQQADHGIKVAAHNKTLLDEKPPKGGAQPTPHPLQSSIQQLLQSHQALMQAMNAPKRVVRDPKTNAVVGVESVLQ